MSADLDPIAFLLVDSVLEGREGRAARVAAVAYAWYAEPDVARRLLNAVCEYEEWPFEPGRVVRQAWTDRLGFVVSCRLEGETWISKVRTRSGGERDDTAGGWDATEIRLEVSTLEALLALNLPSWSGGPARPYMHYI